MGIAPRALPSAALCELLDPDDLDDLLSGRGLRFTSTPAEPVPVPQTFEIPRPNWEQEAAEAAAREREAKEAEAAKQRQEILDSLEAEKSLQDAPAPAKSRKLKLGRRPC